MITFITYQNTSNKKYINASLQSAKVYGESNTKELESSLHDEVMYVNRILKIVELLNEDLNNANIILIASKFGYKAVPKVKTKKSRSYSFAGLTIQEEDI